MKVRTLLVFFCLVLNVLTVRAQDKGIFRGLYNPYENCATALDSAMLERQNELYIGSPDRSMLYYKWLENPLVYTPMMEAAWGYCQKVVPGEKRLYVDARDMYKHVISKCTTRKDSDFYFNKLMKLYDLRLQNLDIINEHARNVEQHTSEGALDLMKIYDYEEYRKKDVAKMDLLSKSSYDEELYVRFLPIMDGIFEKVKQGETVGSDVMPVFLSEFLGLSVNHYIRSFNRVENDSTYKLMKEKKAEEINAKIRANNEWYKTYLEGLNLVKPKNLTDRTAVEEYNKMMISLAKVKDSIMRMNEDLKIEYGRYELEVSNKKTGEQTIPRALLMSHYDGIYSLSDIQKKVLTQGYYNDSTLTEEYQQHKADSISKLYDELIDYCQSLLINNARINLKESTLAELEMKYGDSISVNKKNRAWLSMVWNKCANTSDFDMGDPFCIQIYDAVQAYNTSLVENERDERKKGMNSLKVRSVISPYADLGLNARRKGFSFEATGNNYKAAEYFYLALYYFNKAVSVDDSQRARRDEAGKKAEENNFFANIKGKTLTVDGVTFTAGN